jgi:hypothetical protein
MKTRIITTADHDRRPAYEQAIAEYNPGKDHRLFITDDAHDVHGRLIKSLFAVHLEAENPRSVELITFHTIVKHITENTELKAALIKTENAYAKCGSSLIDIQAENERLRKALKALYESVDSCIELTPEVMKQASEALAQTPGQVGGSETVKNEQ